MGQEPAGSKQTFLASPSPMEVQHKIAEVKVWLRTTTDLPTAKVPSETKEDAAAPQKKEQEKKKKEPKEQGWQAGPETETVQG